ncbi:mechanosensitive ion channel [Oscillatoriales cyanobacterium LEGE 11467]|uniref:Mechanosensitive ion channel n=1 Tax=Zarconia navalis LEGE 11467 TaxID=1828826 RepID=A0A928VZE9_9CYAN|nr:mechanosensitive ion channel domain-containing protein [Zarconia navalis]MBE9041131.1 mechanosensitive ion channel [Zarconia navalis LEGE 11467]
MDTSIVFWGFVIILGVPALAIVLGECIHFFEGRGSRLTPVLRHLRGYVLPSAAILVVMERLLQLPETFLLLKLVETGFWIAVIVTLLALLNAVLTTSEPGTFQIQVPNLLFQALRGLAIVGIAAHVLGDIWTVDIKGITTALGVGSLAIAFALQDTLSNLVSGFLLLASKPFEVGDWIEANGIKGQAIDISWRSVILRNPMGETFEIPNGALGGATIKKYPSTPKIPAVKWSCIKVGFDRKDPPNRVLEALESATVGIDGILKIFPSLGSYDDYWTTYELRIQTAVPKERRISATVKARIYYAAKRYGLTMPVAEQYPPSKQILLEASSAQRSQIADYLRSLPYLTALNSAVLDNLIEEVEVKHYGVGEQIIVAGEPDEGLYVLKAGEVKLTAKDFQDQEREIDRVFPDSFFGEMALLGESSPVSAIATQDVEVIIVYPELARRAIDSSPRLTQEMNGFIEERKRSLCRIQSVENLLEAHDNGKVAVEQRSLLERLTNASKSSREES